MNMSSRKSVNEALVKKFNELAENGNYTEFELKLDENYNIVLNVHKDSNAFFTYLNEVDTIIIDDGVEDVQHLPAASHIVLYSSIAPDCLQSISRRSGRILKSMKILRTKTINHNLNKIKSNTFWSCRKLESVELCEGITEIKAMAFFYCTNLVNINIPKSLTSIGKKAFAHTGITKLDIDNTNALSHISKKAFKGCKFESFFIPDSWSEDSDLVLDTKHLRIPPKFKRKAALIITNHAIFESMGAFVYGDALIDCDEIRESKKLLDFYKKNIDLKPEKYPDDSKDIVDKLDDKIRDAIEDHSNINIVVPDSEFSLDTSICIYSVDFDIEKAFMSYGDILVRDPDDISIKGEIDIIQLIRDDYDEYIKSHT